MSPGNLETVEDKHACGDLAQCTWSSQSWLVEWFVFDGEGLEPVLEL